MLTVRTQADSFFTAEETDPSPLTNKQPHLTNLLAPVGDASTSSVACRALDRAD